MDPPSCRKFSVNRRGAGGPAPLLLFPEDRAAAEAEAARLAAELVQHDRMRIHEADLSPPDMAGQACWAIEADMGLRWGDDGPARIFDPTCGAGIFPAAARLQWPRAEIVGCEARAEEEPHVAHNCDRYWIGDTFGRTTWQQIQDVAVKEGYEAHMTGGWRGAWPNSAARPAARAIKVVDSRVAGE